MKNYFYFIFIILLTSCCHTVAIAQFYNGSAVTFGKNKVQYNTTDWYYLRYKKYDVYAPTSRLDLAKKIAVLTPSCLQEIEKTIDSKLKGRIVFVVYESAVEAMQSNMDLAATPISNNTAGTREISFNTISIIQESASTEDIKTQIKKGIAEVLLAEVTRPPSDIAPSLPTWFHEGWIRYVSKGWNAADAAHFQRLQAGGLSYKKLLRLPAQDATVVGQAIWNYIVEQKGKDILIDMYYLAQYNGNIEYAFQSVGGQDFSTLFASLLQYYPLHSLSPQDSITHYQRIVSRNKITELVANPSTTKIAYWQHTNFRKKLILQSGTKKKKIATTYQNADLSQPLPMAWDTSGVVLYYLDVEKGNFTLTQYNTNTTKNTTKYLPYFGNIYSMKVHPDGVTLLLSASQNGDAQVYTYNFLTNNSQKITTNVHGAMGAVWDNAGTSIYFLQPRDSTATYYTVNTIAYPITAKSKPTPLYCPEKVNVEEIQLFQEYKIAKVSIDNQYYWASIHADSVVVYDTKILPNTTCQITKQGILLLQNPTLKNYNLEHQSINFLTTRKKILPTTLVLPTPSISKTPQKTQLPTPTIPNPIKNTTTTQQADSSTYTQQTINIQENYSTTTTKYDPYWNKSISLEKPVSFKHFAYTPDFYIDKLGTQLDRSYLNTTYQPFLPSNPFYTNAPISNLFQVGSSDVFKNWRVTLGARISFNLLGNEYFVGIEKLDKRIDHQLLAHQLVTVNRDNNKDYRVHTQELIYKATLPFSEIQAIKFSSTIRWDKLVAHATDNQTLVSGYASDVWGILRGEYVYDATLPYLLKYQKGIKAKVSLENYNKLGKTKLQVNALSVDIRYYKPIHRELVFCIRLAGATSFGKHKIIYYMGGIDNQLSFDNTPTSPTIDNTQKYVFQALATNMRGFAQGTRNGSSFALINAEVRVPLFNYLAGGRLQAGFWRNLEVVAFLDVGSAWVGSNPYSTTNTSKNKILVNGPITLYLKNYNSPIIWSNGLGMRMPLWGYYLRVDIGTGRDTSEKLRSVAHLSFQKDF